MPRPYHQPIDVVVPCKVRKQFDSDVDTLAMDQKTINRTSAVSAYHHPTALYHALVHGMRTDFVLTVPTATRNRIFERGLWATVGSANSQQPRP